MQFSLHVLIMIGLFLPAALGYNLVFGKGKVFHFGLQASALVGAYSMFLSLLAFESFFAALFIGLLSVVLFSCVLAWLSLRLEPDAMGVMSIAVHLSTLAVVLNWTSVTRGALGVPRIPRLPGFENMIVYTIAVSLIAIVLVYLYHRLDRSALGRQIDALSEHDWHARSLGINRTFVHIFMFIALGVTQMIGVFFYIPYLRLLHPNDFQFPALIFMVMLVVAGRPGSVKGVVVSTILLVILKEAVRFLPVAPSVLGPIRLLLFGVILFGAVWWRRDTLFPHERKV